MVIPGRRHCCLALCGGGTGGGRKWSCRCRVRVGYKAAVRAAALHPRPRGPPLGAARPPAVSPPLRPAGSCDGDGGGVFARQRCRAPVPVAEARADTPLLPVLPSLVSATGCRCAPMDTHGGVNTWTGMERLEVCSRAPRARSWHWRMGRHHPVLCSVDARSPTVAGPTTLGAVAAAGGGHGTGESQVVCLLRLRGSAQGRWADRACAPARWAVGT